MNDKLKTMIKTLNSFLLEMEQLKNNPYSKGIDVDVLLKDLKNFATALEEEINKLDITESTDEKEQA